MKFKLYQSSADTCIFLDFIFYIISYIIKSAINEYIFNALRILFL